MAAKKPKPKAAPKKAKDKTGAPAPRHGGPRAFWKGNLKLSLVSCPVLMYPATEAAASLRFNLINPRTNNRIKMETHDAGTGEEVPRNELVKGYQYEKGKYVIVEDEDFDKARIESTHTISMESFVPAPEIDCFYTETPYYIVPDGKEAVESYLVIHEAMKNDRVVGIGYVVIGQRERLVGVAPKGKGFVLNTLRTGAEMRKADDYFENIPAPKVEKEMVEIARQIIAKREGHFKPGQYVDHYEEALMKIISAKVKGREVVVAEEPTGGKVINLMDALKKSLKREEGGAEEPATKRKRG